ncbi:MAG TPA: sugar-binding domain-containing protein, partial [Symbiobacteriaceae bacterium]|nr:sugar-binding domain-containing protein [Symbiobacteriaceae bacterium]
MLFEHMTYRVAYLRYIEDLSQKEIAARVGLSTPTVSRLLRLAQTQGLVQITIRDPYAHYFEMEKHLCEQFPLREAIITRTPPDTPPHVARTAVARDGADYLRRIVRDGDVIGVGWGHT